MSVVSGNEIAGSKTSAKNISDMIQQIIQGILDMIRVDGPDEFSRVMKDGKVMGIAVGSGKGDNKVEEAVDGVIASATASNCDFSNSSYISIVIRGGDFSLSDQYDIEDRIKKFAGKDIDSISVDGTDEAMKDEIRVTVVALK